MSKFPCTGCGACCRRVGFVVPNMGEIIKERPELEFPYSWDENGHCEMLNDDNSCKVYEHRPLICNIEKMNKLRGSETEERLNQNIEACHTMMKEDGIYDEFKIN